MASNARTRRLPAQAQALLGVDGLTRRDARLSEALTVRGRRRLRADSTTSVGGLDWQLDGTFLSGQLITVARSLVDPQSPPWVEHEDKTLPLRLVDPKHNAHAGRPKRHARQKKGIDGVAFDPNAVLLDAALGRSQGAPS